MRSVHRGWYFVVFWLTAALFSSVTMKTALVARDSEAIQQTLYAYGFPLPWHRWSTFSSLVWHIDYWALAVDIAAYGLGALSVMALLRTRLKSAPSRALVAVSVALFLFTTPLLVLQSLDHRSLDFSSDPFFEPAWRALHVGLDFPYEPW